MWSYSYDTGTNRKGRLVSLTKPGGDGYFYDSYDAAGRVTTSRQITDGNSYSFTYGYDVSGNLTRQVYPSGREVLTGYDSAGRINLVKGVKGTTSTVYASQMSYTAQGAVKLMQLGSGKWEHANFNSRLQPTEIGLGTSATDSSLLKLEYTYGVLVGGVLDTTKNNGNIESQKISFGTGTHVQSYSYDSLNRLSVAEEKLSGNSTWKQVYEYDRWGNRAVTLASTLVPTPALTPRLLTDYSTSTNRIVLSGYVYDTAGNLLKEPGQANNNEFDAENRMTKYNGTGGQYSYDGDGRRVKKVANGVTTLMVYNVAGQLIAEYNSPDQPIAGQGGTSYLTSDHLGSTRVVTDRQGNVVTRRDYLPFGEEISAWIGNRSQGHIGHGYNQTDGVKQRFTSKERDDESKLDYFLARYYSSVQGRFTGVDPFNIILEAQYTSDVREARSMVVKYLSEPKQWNRYNYALNNPLLYIDPTGERIIIAGGTVEQQQAVEQAIVRLRDQSPLANAAFARFDGTGPDAPDLTITILDDVTFESQVTSTNDPSNVEGITESGGIIEDKDPRTGRSSFIVNVNVSLRSSAINLQNDQRNQRNDTETRTEAILSHEVPGHAVDLSRNPREHQANITRDRGLPYRQRANEKSANRASHRVVMERISGRHIRHIQRNLHWLNE